MHPDTHLVIQLQSLDQRIAALDKEVAALPKHIAAIEKTLESHLRKLEADRAALAANQKDRKKLEGDIQIHEQKISKLRDQMLQRQNQRAIPGLPARNRVREKEIRKAEDRILELMSESEPLDQNVKKAEAALKEEKQVVEGEKNRAGSARRPTRRSSRRFAPNARKPRPETSRARSTPTYERIRKKWHGTVIAEAVGGRCSACQIVIRPQIMQDLKKGEQLMHCESCGRFLYYNRPGQRRRRGLRHAEDPRCRFPGSMED